MTNEKIKQLREEVGCELKGNILPFWSSRMIDGKNGGFIGQIDGGGVIHADADKGGIMNARILWTFSSAYRILKQPEYLQIATRAKKYILDYFIDKQYGGTFWCLNAKGEVADGKKQIYNLSFAIYALVEYFRATGDQECLDTAKGLYTLIEKYSFDPKRSGYYEAFSREWGEIADLRLSEKDANERKTMNTHLHVLEAYTNLFRVWKDDGLKQQLRGLILNFSEHIINSKTYHLDLFFDDDWNCKSKIISYGHDIECSWLLYEAAVVLGDDKLTSEIKNICLKIALASCEGLQLDGSLVYERESVDGHLDTDRHWWVQAEAVVGFFNAYELAGNEDYLNKAIKTWEFISKHIVDKTNGEWFWSVNKNMEPNLKDDKAGFWKCPYHNSRMCLELIERSHS